MSLQITGRFKYFCHTVTVILLLIYPMVIDYKHNDNLSIDDEEDNGNSK